MAKSQIVSIKEFLNKDGFHSLASIGFFMDDDIDGWITSALKITDCTKTITIDLDMSDFKDQKNAVHKLDTMIEVCTLARKAIKKQGDKHLPEIIKKKKKRGR